jgi:hypothetical protein
VESKALELPLRLDPKSVNIDVRPRTYPHPLYFCGTWKDYLPADFLKPDLIHLLRAMPQRSLVILIPTELNPRSNGHACILHLALDLQAAGADVSLLPTIPYLFFRTYFQKLRPRFKQLRFIANPSEASTESYLLVPESIKSAHVKRLRRYFARIIWWNLAPAGVLTPFSPDIKSQDLLTFFSPFVMPDRENYHFIQPPLPKPLRNLARQYSPQRSAGQTILLYTGKGRMKPLPRKLHKHLLPYSIELITRSHPETKTELIELLSDSQGLISFDSMTNLSLEAAIAGLPVYLPCTAFAERAYRDFPVDLRDYLDTSSEDFIHHLSGQGPVQRISPASLYDAHRKSIRSFLLILCYPIYAESFHCTQQTLSDIEDYRRFLLKSKTIQVALQGEAASSSLVGLYVKSLKHPYAYHLILCNLLSWIDNTADLLHSLSIFRPLQPVLRYMRRVSRKLLSPVMHIGKTISK